MHMERASQIGCFFFNDTATTEIYTLSLHDALPICSPSGSHNRRKTCCERDNQTRDLTLLTGMACLSGTIATREADPDRKSTRLNSSHANISYAVFCLKKKKTVYQFDSPILHPSFPL